MTKTYKINIIESANEIYWATTHQGTWEVNGKEIEFRFHENSNGAEFYVWHEDKGWVEMYDMDPGSPEDIVYSMCIEATADEWGEAGDEIEWEWNEEDWV